MLPLGGTPARTKLSSSLTFDVDIDSLPVAIPMESTSSTDDGAGPHNMDCLPTRRP